MYVTHDVAIHNNFVPSESLGDLHVVRFQPLGGAIVDRAIISNSLAGDVLSPDGFGVPYGLAASGQDTLYVEFPGSGFSSMPQDKTLRRDYLKHGAEALGDAVSELLVDSDTLLDFTFSELTIGGFSLGAVRSASLLPVLGNKVKGFVSSDAAGFGSHPTYRNMKRYKNHISSSRVEMAKFGETVDGYFLTSNAALESFKTTEGQGLLSRRGSMLVRATELRAIYDSMNPVIIKNVKGRMVGAISRREQFELRAGFVANTYALDGVVVDSLNAELEQLERAAEENEAPVKAAFIQGDWFGIWHDQGVDPERIHRLLHEPTESLSKRLVHRYMP